MIERETPEFLGTIISGCWHVLSHSDFSGLHVLPFPPQLVLNERRGGCLILSLNNFIT